MSASAAVTLLIIPAFIVTAVALSLVRARLRTLEAASSVIRVDLARRDEASDASDRSRRQMLVDVSHELRTPLTAMRGYLETLRMTGPHLDEITRTRYFQTLERETVRLDRLVEEIHGLNRRLDAGENLAPLVHELRALNESLSALAYAALGAQGPQVRRRHAS